MTKHENIRVQINAIDAKIARLKHRRDELEARSRGDEAPKARTSWGLRTRTSASDASPVRTTSRTPSQTDTSDQFTDCLNVLRDNLGDEAWRLGSIPPFMVGQLAETERRQLIAAIREHNLAMGYEV